ncbi:MAG: GGDEF and EAL domain-containing protein [Sphingomonas sp.]|uniref:putative bifunctional diguanylate cyclase/phosphodiesterase n=1 Tax=Sphingomonas sp. TaxID=28214 RepID=UPI0025FD0D5E|nr:GGDEF and EAL domain-containing protein [Sphingomonas sp.]MBX9882085.1 GGDEF and EAL domain-containing protein [Sphingomonas sp.]
MITPPPRIARPLGQLTTGITLLAILVFVATASAVLSLAFARSQHGASLDRGLTIALLLNIALILLGWRRQRVLVEELKAAQTRALVAGHDALTGLLARRAFGEAGAAAIAQARARNRLAALVLIDIDRVKRVNDLHGHAVGDALVKAIASEVVEASPHGAPVARLSGTEFACLLPVEPSYPETVDRFAERLAARLAEPFQVDGRPLQVEAAIGIARSDAAGWQVDSLIRAASIALAAAKSAESAPIIWFEAAMARELEARNAVERALRVAIPRHEIVPYFEPQVDLTTGALTGFEALARWERPNQPPLTPDRFIPIAEESGLIDQLSLALMLQAFAQARDWDAELSVAANLSPAQLKDAWLAQKIVKLLTETGFPAHRLELEITEAALIDNLPLAQSTLTSLKEQGVKLVLDDFGTGYSSLSHLRALPLDRLKIDCAYVGTLNDSSDSASVVNAILRLAESLNLPVIAEGVRDGAIAERLKAMGCQRAQGYLYGQPMAPAAARTMLAERRLLRGALPAAPRAAVG